MYTHILPYYWTQFTQVIPVFSVNLSSVRDVGRECMYVFIELHRHWAVISIGK